MKNTNQTTPEFWLELSQYHATQDAISRLNTRDGLARCLAALGDEMRLWDECAELNITGIEEMEVETIDMTARVSAALDLYESKVDFLKCSFCADCRTL